ncbi:uncharacterized protein BKCO1_1600038 [Diplodia corticola]|uniref:Ubiquitin 3 binding protein But2 C-terminal domain-containing protein n=1 Tax=Diplodia corticola TaxID=236234 RepID=A0A1J9S535_9PEZI|nr:uncharacterized protein BKCO1_1600038 [Diplodia corticola]OJD35631.1 hypothetical protein BKCO1_1600038 [Diplodia corticola]
MHLTTLTTTATALLSLAAAAPAPAPATGTQLSRRACTTQYPTHLFQIMQDDPEHNTGDHGYVYTAQSVDDATKAKTHQWITELQFAGIPAGAYGCSVELFFEAGYNDGGANNQPGITTTGGTPENPVRLDFFATADGRDVSLADSWLSHPAEGARVGTAQVVARSDADTRVTVVTGECRSTLNYLVEVQGDGAGSVGFFQSPPNGLRLTYNC